MILEEVGISTLEERAGEVAVVSAVGCLRHVLRNVALDVAFEGVVDQVVRHEVLSTRQSYERGQNLLEGIANLSA